MNAKKEKVFVGMSGGVDSSVAALLLQKQGYDLVGCFIKGWYPEGFVCNWKEDRRDAMRVCAKLGIPFLTIDATKEYKKDVVDYMIREYKVGRTPNPDVMCNRNIKFGVFLKKALEMGANYIATGHYVKLKVKSAKLKVKKFELATARDLNKDQSYFLWTLTQSQLKHSLFPLGELVKPEVREIAQKAGLPTADKRESQGVCFIGEFDIMDFLKRYIKPKKGKVITDEGKEAGEHEGVMFYTIGQRHGFGFGGGIPYYIVAKDIEKNLLVVADKVREEKFYAKTAEIQNLNWVSEVPKTGKLYKTRIRYRQPLQSCRITALNKNSAKISFIKPQRALTSGQSLVLYDAGGKMLGGGIIK